MTVHLECHSGAKSTYTPKAYPQILPTIIAEDFGSDNFDFGSRGFEFRDPSFGGSGFGDWSFPSSSPTPNNHPTFDFFGGCNPYSGFSLDRPKPSAYSSVPKGPRNYEYDFFVSSLRERGASSSSEPPMAPTSDTTFMPRAFTTQRGSSNDSPGYKAPLNFIDQSLVTWNASDSGLPRLDIQLKTPLWAKVGRLECDHSFTFDPHADLTFPCTSKKVVYKSPLERVEFGLGSYADLPTWTSTQDAWIAFDVTGSRSSWIDTHVTRLHSHLPGENKDDCLACISSRLGLDGVGVAVDHHWNNHAKTKAGCDIGLKTGGKTCFVEHHHKVDGCGEGKVKVQHRTKSPGERGAHRDASMLPNWLVDLDRYTVLIARGPHEVAKPRFDGQRHGASSHLLLKDLEGVGFGMISKYIHSYLCVLFRRPGLPQGPVLYDRRNQALFGLLNSDNTATVISVVERDGTLELQTGYAHGIEEGDRLALYPLGTATSDVLPEMHSVYAKVVSECRGS
ncbi:hypothetical protein NCS52_01523800 [Fusarium sp. LHS14.1]|nr:hypothetical protein NCS52_01523800 [Fusarium sp. LHS14.1]